MQLSTNEVVEPSAAEIVPGLVNVRDVAAGGPNPEPQPVCTNVIGINSVVAKHSPEIRFKIVVGLNK